LKEDTEVNVWLEEEVTGAQIISLILLLLLGQLNKTARDGKAM